mmetsp:Transcript_75964/g.235208  ORF Transcript_75964/g.235208 Transcript_75964/m.235208 type:complete len:296 (-) Transcript_75964:161-1048(-)
MALAQRALLLGAAAAAVLLRPAAALHGYLDSQLGGGHGSRAAGRVGQGLNGTRSLVDAFQLALRLTSDMPFEPAGVPHADQVFDKYDLQDPHGFLSVSESTDLLKDLGFTEAEVGQLLNEMDANADGLVDKAELSSYIQLPQAAPAPAPAPPSLQTVANSAPTAAPVAAPAPPIKAWVPPAAPINKPRAAPPGDAADTGKMLQGRAARTQDTLVDALENAQVAEIKRSVFRSLGRMRFAQIKEYDTIAKLQTDNVDQYNDVHAYRSENPLTHLSEEEGPIDQDKYATFRRRQMWR